MTKPVDLFPAIIYLAEPGSIPSGDPTDLPFQGPKPPRTRKVDRARVAIHNGSLYIVQDSPEGPRVIFREKVLLYVRDRNRRTHHAVTETGKIATFAKDVNCGCGSRLRSWSPFGATAHSSQDPLQ